MRCPLVKQSGWSRGLGRGTLGVPFCEARLLW